MAAKEKKEIEIAGGAKVLAQTPIIVSASQSTDIKEGDDMTYIELLTKAVQWFYKNDASYTKDVDERAMVGCVYRYMWCILQQKVSFSVADIDIEYDRMGNSEDAIRKCIEVPENSCKSCDRKKECYAVLKSKIERKSRDKIKYEFRPDIIVHQRGDLIKNGLVIEFKKRSRGAKLDIAKLMYCTCENGAFKYDVGAFVLFEATQAHIEVFVDGKVNSMFKVNSEGRCEYDENEKIPFSRFALNKKVTKPNVIMGKEG